MTLSPSHSRPAHRRVPPNLQPIGVFDSGVGGLSVWRELTTLLPAESTIYLADQAHVPYGARTAADVEALTHEAAGWLLAREAKLLVIACNTASAAALSSLRQRWPDVPIVGMEPAVKPASAQTLTHKVGVMATPGTLNADRFVSLVERFASGVEVHTQVCPGLVELVEAGDLDGPLVEAHLHSLLDPLVAADIDHLVLGCTHYPFLAPAIQRVVGERVTLVDPAPAVARQAQRLLTTHDLLATGPLPAGPLLALPAGGTAPTHRFFTTGDAAPMRISIAQLLGLQASVEQASLAPRERGTGR